MSGGIEIIQDRDLQAGWINIGKACWPAMGIKPTPKAKSLHGLAFTNLEQLDAAIAFLTEARETFRVSGVIPELFAVKDTTKRKKKRVKK